MEVDISEKASDVSMTPECTASESAIRDGPSFVSALPDPLVSDTQFDPPPLPLFTRSGRPRREYHTTKAIS